jgi:hypothetical protein
MPALAGGVYQAGLVIVWLHVRAENLVHGSDQESCHPCRPAVMINGHVPTVHVPRDHSASRVVTPVPA